MSPSASPSQSEDSESPSSESDSHSESDSTSTSSSASPSAAPRRTVTDTPTETIPEPENPVAPVAKPVLLANSLFVLNKMSENNETATQTRVPTWNSLGRPSKAKAGTLGFNFETQCLEFWDGENWIQLQMTQI